MARQLTHEEYLTLRSTARILRGAQVPLDRAQQRELEMWEAAAAEYERAHGQDPARCDSVFEGVTCELLPTHTASHLGRRDRGRIYWTDSLVQCEALTMRDGTPAPQEANG